VKYTNIDNTYTLSWSDGGLTSTFGYSWLDFKGATKSGSIMFSASLNVLASPVAFSFGVNGDFDHDSFKKE